MGRGSARYRELRSLSRLTARKIVGLGCVPIIASCAGMFASEISVKEASKYQRIEDFVPGNFRTAGSRVFDDGSVRYVESFCAGDKDALRKPGADLGTFCEAKGGVFQDRTSNAFRRSLAPGLPAYAESEYDCNAQGTSTVMPGSSRPITNPEVRLWNATVRVEGVGPGLRPDCFRVALLIRGETWTAEKQAAESEERDKAWRALERSEK